MVKLIAAIVAIIFPLFFLLLMVGLPPVTTQQDTTYYVTPNPNASCSGREPCHTFSDYLQGSLNFSSPDVSQVTLVFEIGTHELNGSNEYTIAGIERLTLVGDSGDVRPGIKLTFFYPVTIRIRDIPRVEIRDLVFAEGGCGAQTSQMYEYAFYGMLQVDGVDSFEVSNCTFCHNCNTTLSLGAGTQLAVRDSSFTANQRSPLILVGSSVTFLGDVTFTRNEMKFSTQTGGAIIAFFDATIIFKGNTNFTDNMAFNGGAIYAYNSSLEFLGRTQFLNNTADVQGGAIDLESTTATFAGTTLFSNNVAMFGGSLFLYDNTSITFSGNTSFVHNNATRGGAVNAQYSNITELSGSLNFVSNRARIGGGATFLSHCTVNLLSESLFFQNLAEYGGAMQILRSELKLSGSHNYTENRGGIYGGGLYLIRSSITCNGSVSLVENRAGNIGGGLHLTGNSVCNFMPDTTVYLSRNYAKQQGGAINVQDISFTYCESVERFNNPLVQVFPRCFFQVPAGDLALSSIRLIFEDNFAENGGTAIYGSRIDNCLLADVSQNLTSSNVFDAITEFPDVNIIQAKNYTTRQMTQILSTISSDPYQVCPCSNGFPNCGNDTVDIEIPPGARLSLSLVATGQRSGTVPTVIRSFFDSGSANVVEFENAQATDTNCADLHYTVFSQSENFTSETQTLNLYAEGPCSRLGRTFRVFINFTDCPIGFDVTNGACNCCERLAAYTNSCNVTDEKILRGGESTFWAGLDDQTSELVTYPNCPFGYCTSTAVLFTLKEAHLQCDSNRIGLLCGKCSSNSSLVFGTSRCKKCPSNNTIAHLITFAIAGIVLVAFMFVFRLTVATGTTNALIFYANIIVQSRTVLFPQNPNPLTVFISWINLDLGIETCFFKGMDEYDRTWLQFVFPVYLWIMAGFIVIASFYIPRFSRVFGSNPVAVLATLFLLSYAKILRTIIASFSFAKLEYPDSKTRIVWAYDANLPFANGKHLALFMVALLVFVFLYVPYTLLLFSYQWIRTRSHRKYLRWINSHAIRSLLDAYQAPFKDKHQYWFGLFLIKRSILLIVFATNVTGDPNRNLLLTAMCGAIVAFSCWNIGGIYKKWYLNLIESYFFTKLVIFAAVTYYSKGISADQEDFIRRQTVISNVLLSLDLAVFLAIVVYHAFLQASQTRTWKRLKERKTSQSNIVLQEPGSAETLSIKSSTVTTRSSSNYVTFSVLREPLVDDEDYDIVGV